MKTATYKVTLGVRIQYYPNWMREFSILTDIVDGKICSLLEENAGMLKVDSLSFFVLVNVCDCDL